ncbi:abnormal spindle-like microcephaly-associated protein homolog isoform X2 [Agrilus planipennis]|uniref:Abnormal spindle-like microcephaly-associated protein homolog isoform X1 n=1 Tax=Agrilus planipennis TaxID=224129 RepID=A0A7F5R8X1_AGRPL|nr:abnormal spindle-like microcephaly-associated protein homolog isoform X1 [Agrilus planipennis]XP_025832423.1 abnormal spindle-like microcephaly-associated protein homolog isoform X2 [Agrilus planipennis]
MSFQFNISPPTKLKPVTEPTKVETDETPVLCLAPFTSNPKISFDNIKIGTTESRLLILRNPSSHKIEISVIKQPPPDRNFKILFDKGIIPSKSEIAVELVWCPLCEGAWRDTVIFESGRLKKDVVISYKSIPEKKTQKTTKKVNMPRVVSKKVKTPPKSNKPLKLSKFSPQRKTKISPFSQNLPRRYNSNKVTNFNIKNFGNDKENQKPLHKSHPLDNSNFISPSKVDFEHSIESDIRFSRNTYTVRQNDYMAQIKIENFDDSLEKLKESLENPFEQDKIHLKDLSNMIHVPGTAFQSPKNSLHNKLNSSMFQLTPVQAHKDIRVSLELHPNICSTNRKSIHIEEKVKTEMIPKHGLRLSAFNFDFSFTNGKENTPSGGQENFNMENRFSNDFCMKNNINTETYISERNSDTYIKENLDKPRISDTYFREIVTCDKGNISTETYTKGSPKRNISSETYVKSNLISSEANVKSTINETYLKTNISTETYGDIHNISTSTRLGEEPFSGNFVCAISPMHQLNLSGEGVKGILEANLWCKEKPVQLDFISEETHLPTTSSSESENDSPRKGLKRKSNIHLYLTPPKKTCGSNATNWNRSRYRRSSILDKSKTTVVSAQKNQNFDINIKNPFIIAATTSIDPFLNRTCYDPEWIDAQERNFVKCLNLLLTPPDELNAHENPPDVGKIWQESKQKDLSFAPSKQQVTKNFFFTGRLNNLRKTALSLYRSDEIRDVIQKIGAIVDSNKLSIRKDKNPHLNVSLQSEIMKLFLSYNPFWLQIGLEVVFGTIIELQPKSIIASLHHFLKEKFFKNAFLLRKYKTPQCEKYTLEIKKIILKKFLYIVYFLDVAKNKKLIFYDPCLFSKKAQIKESREILLHFSKELLYAVGDVTKYLKPFGYVLTYKQSYIHEYEYAIKELSSDLRDGVRITRIVELILLRNDLTNELRAPAISRLQKVHNVRVAFEALNSSGFEIKGDIVPTDIVDGHREKTLSLLWQIVYKFQGPRYKEAALTIQNWWRSLRVQIRLRILIKQRETYEKAASTIQRWYKRQKLSQLILRQLVPIAKIVTEEKKMLIAAQKIQSYLRMRVERSKYLKFKALMILLQSHCRKYLVKKRVEKRKWAIVKLQSLCKVWVAKNKFLRLKVATITIQQAFRGYWNMKQARKYFLNLRQACITIQRRFRANKSMKIERNLYVNLRKATVIIQRRYKATIAMKKEMYNYRQLKSATVVIQSQYRAYKIMKHERANYHQLREATIKIQRKYRANKLMKTERQYYSNLKNATIFVQRKYRANIAMRRQKYEYNSLKSAAHTIQRQYRALKAMKSARNYYIRLRASVILIQSRYKANKATKIHRIHYLQFKHSVIFIQRKFRANQEMKKQRDQYRRIKTATVILQRRYRALRIARITKQNYLQLQKATILIQQRFRANAAMKIQRKYYVKLKETVIYIQNKFRANRTSKIARENFQNLRSAVITIQNHYRTLKQMKIARNRYLDLQKATLYIQRLFRAKKCMEETRNGFQKLRKATIIIQRRYRALKLMRKDRNNYMEICKATVLLQTKYRAMKIMKIAKNNYHNLRNATITIQRRYRALKLMKGIRNYYLQVYKATVFIQRKYRANKAMKIAKNDFQNLVQASITIQRRYRAMKRMRIVRHNYLRIYQATLLLQRKYKSYVITKIARNNFQTLRQAVIIIQKRFRAQRLMKSARKEYLDLQKAIQIIQKRYRAQKAMHSAKETYQNLKQATLTIQRTYRMKMVRKYYLELRKRTIFIQRLYKANKAMKSAKNDFQKLKNTTVGIQRRYRALILMRDSKNNYQNLKRATIVIQRHFRAKRAKEIARNDFLNLRHSAIVIQKRYRAIKLMKTERNNYQQLKQATITIQNRFRANRTMKIVKRDYQNLREATINVQRRYRALKLMKNNRCDYLNLRRAAIFVQRKYRANMMMKIAKIEYQRLRNASITIQRKYKALKSMKNARDDYLQLQKAALFVQRKYRATMAMKMTKTYFQMIRKYTIVIQRRYRALRLMKSVRKDYLNIYKATLVIQQKYKANKAMKIERAYYIKLKTLTVVLQRRYRAKLKSRIANALYSKLKTASIIIQRAFRRYLLMKKTRQQFLQKHNAAIVIQRKFRANELMKQQRIYYISLREKVIVLQVKYRAKRAMLREIHKYNNLRNATVTIQRWYRSINLMRTQRREYILLKKYTILIQRRYRASVAMRNERQRYLTLKKAVIIIQNRFRAKRHMINDRSRYLNLKKIVVKVQRTLREKKIEREKMEAIVNLQRCIKGYLFRKKFKKEFTSRRQEREKQIKEHNAAIKIQANWRGYFERKGSSSEINNIYSRLENATNNAHPEKTLGHRREQCLHLLIQDNPSMGQIIRALTDLDFITRRCRDTCMKLSKILPENLFKMIISAIRSLPDMKASVLATSILINFCKYPPTKEASWVPEYIERTFQVMLHWCDKDEPLFPYLCTLIWLYAHNEDYRKYIVQIPNIVNILTKMKGLCQRKQKMWERSSLKGISLFSVYKNLPIPLTTPDWGLDYVDHPRIFNNSVHALDCLIKQLRLKIK